MCVRTSASDSAAARKMVGGSRIERRVVGWRPVKVICPAEGPGQSALIECDDGRDRWFHYEQLPEELRLDNDAVS